jgi:hypothetical protein
MMLLEFRCSGYKAFREPTRIQLRPLTVFFGKNNSGKSALLRLPRLIFRALSTRAKTGFPLRVDDLNFGETFAGLTHGGLAHGKATFGLTVKVDSAQLDIDATVQNVQNMQSALGQPKEFSVVSHLHISDPLVELEWEPRSEMVARYRNLGEIPFRGMFPEVRGHSQLGASWEFVEEWRERIQLLEDQISHLGPVRTDVPRLFEGGAFPSLGFDGSGAMSRLGQDSNLLALVSSWFQTNLDGWAISLDYAGSAFRCLLRRGEISVNMADAGHGMQQVLPVVVQQLAHRTGSSSTFLDLVEQPELHLHASAQAPLGDLFLDTVKHGKCQVILETHSENLLLRLRRRVAEGIDPALIRLYYVEENPDGYSMVRPVDILPDGSVDWWPEGVFAEGYEELKALNRASRKQ